MSRRTGTHVWFVVVLVLLALLAFGCRTPVDPDLPEGESDDSVEDDAGTDDPGDGNGNGDGDASDLSSLTGHAFFTNRDDHSGITVSMEEVVESQTASVTRAISGERSAQSSLYRQTTTNAVGEYSLTDIEPGTYTVYASHSATLEKALSANITVTASSNLTVDDLYLTPTGTITGIVTLEGVSAGSYGGTIVYLAGTSYLAVTDANGNFEITGVPEGSDFVLVATMHGYVDSSQTVAVTGLETTEIAPIELALAPAAPDEPDTSPPVIQGVTYTPLPAVINRAATIIVDAQDAESILTLSFDTDDDGAFDDSNTPTFTSIGLHPISVKATSEGGSVTESMDIEVVNTMPDQTRPRIESITHSPDPAYVGDDVTIVVSVVDDESTPVTTYDTDQDGTFDDPQTITYTSTGIKAVDVKVASDGGQTVQTHYINVISATYDFTVSGPTATTDDTPTWTWNLPEGDLEKFRYRLERVASPDNVVVLDWTETADTSTTSYTADPLTPAESYIFSVQAQNIYGEWSNSAFRTTLIMEGDSVYDGSYTFADSDFADDVDSWVAGGYTEITGSLTINTNGAGGITNVDFLAGLEKIGGGLWFYGPDLVDLSGLSDLVEVGGNVGFSDNSSWPLNDLPNLDGLENLRTIGGSLSFGYCYSLQNITALSGLIEIGGGIFIDYNPVLTSLAGLQNVNCRVTNLVVEDNELLQDISALSGVIVDGVDIDNNASLTSLSGLEGVRGIGASIYIQRNDSLMNLSGLDNLGHVDGTVWIDDNDDLTTLAGLGATFIEGQLTIEDNDSLTDITELLDYTILYGLDIDNNDALVSLDGLDNLSTVAGTLTIENNAALEDFSALDLTQVQGNLILRNNGEHVDTLPNFTANGGCSFGTVLGSLTIAGHDYLDSLEGMGIDAVGGSITISQNTELADIAALSALTGGDSCNLDVFDNDALTSLAGLQGLTRSNNTSISNNSGLESLAGLENMDRANWVSIYNNANLTDLSALTNLRAQRLTLYGLDSLQNFTEGVGLTGMRIDDGLNIGDHSWGGNPQLTSLNGLTDLTLNYTNNCTLEIYGNAVLSDISALGHAGTDLTDLVNLHIESNAALPDLAGLENLETVSGLLEIRANGNLSDISALGSLTSVYNVEILSNSDLADPTGLEGIAYAYRLDIYNNDFTYLASGAEETDITVGAGADFTSSGTGDYFTFDDGTASYNVWYNVGGGNTGPGGTDIQVAITAGDTAATIAEATVTEIEGSAAAVFVDSWDNEVFIMNTTVADATDVTVTQGGTALSALVPRPGSATGSGLINLSDVENWLDIDNNASLQTLGLASMNGDSMSYLYVDDNSSLNQGKALRFFERNTYTSGGSCSGNNE